MRDEMKKLLVALLLVLVVTACAPTIVLAPLPRGLEYTQDGRLLLRAGRFALYPPCKEEEKPKACEEGQLCVDMTTCNTSFGFVYDMAWEPK